MTPEEIWDLAHEVAKERLEDVETLDIVEIAEAHDFDPPSEDDIRAVRESLNKASVTIP